MSKISIDKLVDEYQKGKAAIEETEAGLKVIKDEILDQLKAMKLTGLKTKNGYFVRSISMTSFSDVPMEWARQQGATVQKEVLDLPLMRKLQDKGITIPKAKVIKYIKVEEAT